MSSPSANQLPENPGTTEKNSSSIGRRMNDYESMLVRSTCNVGLFLTIKDCKNLSIQTLHHAWKRYLERYDLLRVSFEKTNEMGMFGPRYDAKNMDPNHHLESLLQIEQEAPPKETTILQRLQHVGCTLLNPSIGSYAIKGYMWSTPGATTSEEALHNLELILSLSHAVSDGPGALQVANAFLEDLLQTINGARNSLSTMTITPSQPLIDLQAQILGSDYGASRQERQDDKKYYSDAVCSYQEAVKAAIAKASVSSSSPYILPPEAKQGIPPEEEATSEDGQKTEKKSGCIDFIYIEFSQQATQQLREVCRSAGATIQGAISVASLLARIQALDELKKLERKGINAEEEDKKDQSVQCVIQVPMNARKLVEAATTPTGVDSGGKTSSSEDAIACLCGSAGVVHDIEIPPMEKGKHDPSLLLKLASTCTERMRQAIQDGQPTEWLYRLMNAPATLHPYSLMASSIGVAPISKVYEDKERNHTASIKVNNCLFFGAALDTPLKAQGTMVHAIGFDGRLQIAMNFTSPGIQRKFMERSADIFKSVLLSMIQEEAL